MEVNKPVSSWSNEDPRLSMPVVENNIPQSRLPNEDSKKSTPISEINVPLSFWFNRDPRLSIPFISIPIKGRYDHLRIPGTKKYRIPRMPHDLDDDGAPDEPGYCEIDFGQDADMYYINNHIRCVYDWWSTDKIEIDIDALKTHIESLIFVPFDDEYEPIVNTNHG